MWLSFHIEGKTPSSKWLFRSLESEKDIGVDIKSKNFPEIPQWENCDLLVNLMILAVSSGLVFNVLHWPIPGSGSNKGTSSEGLFTVDFSAKCAFKISLFDFGSSIICSFNWK